MVEQGESRAEQGGAGSKQGGAHMVHVCTGPAGFHGTFTEAIAVGRKEEYGWRNSRHIDRGELGELSPPRSQKGCGECLESVGRYHNINCS